MTRSQLLKQLTFHCPHLTLQEAATVVTSFCQHITQAVAQRESVTLRDSGRFKLKVLPPRQGYNLTTKQRVSLPMKRSLTFRAARALNASVNQRLCQDIRTTKRRLETDGERQPSVSAPDIQQTLQRLLETIASGLIQDGVVKMTGFGIFRVIEKKERLGRNPKTKEQKMICARRVISFQPPRSSSL